MEVPAGCVDELRINADEVLFANVPSRLARRVDVDDVVAIPEHDIVADKDIPAIRYTNPDGPSQPGSRAVRVPSIERDRVVVDVDLVEKVKFADPPTRIPVDPDPNHRVVVNEVVEDPDILRHSVGLGGQGDSPIGVVAGDVVVHLDIVGIQIPGADVDPGIPDVVDHIVVNDPVGRSLRGQTLAAAPEQIPVVVDVVVGDLKVVDVRDGHRLLRRFHGNPVHRRVAAPDEFVSVDQDVLAKPGSHA